MDLNLAPIALFVYKRLWHTQKTVDALKRNQYALESDLFIFSDSYKTVIDKSSVEMVRNFIKGITGFKSVTIIENDINFGLANSIINGVSIIINKFNKIIVVEDDLVTAPYFLKFMNDGLNFYEFNNRVISIHGYVYPYKEELPDQFFTGEADCWGWATWKRGWDLFEVDGSILLKQIHQKKLEKSFNMDGAYDYTDMLAKQVKGKINSWAIRWQASAFLHNKLTLNSGKPLVQNIGNFDGTHANNTEDLNVILWQNPIEIKPIPLEINLDAYQAKIKYIKYLYRLDKKLISFLYKLKNMLMQKIFR
jgi:hypothetical protein